MSSVVTTTPIHSVLPKGLDTFICSASFESRCLVVPSMLHRDKYSVENVLISWNVNHLNAVQKNKQKLFEIFSNPVACELSTDDPLVTADQFMRGLRELFSAGGDSMRIGVDVTTFTRESLLILLRCLVEMMRPGDSVIGLYSRASAYEGTAEGDRWLSHGVREVRSVFGYPGDFKPTRRTHLVVLAGFEDDRALQITAVFEPSVLSLGIPDPTAGHASEHNEKMQLRKTRWLSHLGSRVKEFNFDSYSVDKCIDSVCKAIRSEHSMNTILAAMNTKISTVAAGICALQNPEVQVSYAQADIYNYESYSMPAKEVYVFDLSNVLAPLISVTGKN